MKFLVALSCVLAVACAKPGIVAHTPLAYSNVISHHTVAAAPIAYSSAYVNHAAPIAHTIAAAPVAHTVAAAPVAHTVAAAPVVHTAVATPVVAAPVVQKTQYHAQDAIGQASYGHSEPFQAHNAVQDAAGNKVGSFSYVAPDGQVFATNYVADALGYRVSSNAAPVAPAVPVDTVEVAAARAAHFQAHALVRSRARRAVVAAYSAAPYVAHGYTAPLVHHTYAAPVVHAPVVHTPAVSYHVY